MTTTSSHEVEGEGEESPSLSGDVRERASALRDNAQVRLQEARARRASQEENSVNYFIKRHSVALSVASALIGFAAAIFFRRARSSEIGPEFQVDFVQIVNGVADRFEKWHQMRVDIGARDALIKPALPHLLSVRKALDNGEISLDFLESSIMTILDNAKSVALTRKWEAINEDSINISMKKYCPYIFWC